jgi:hypothetical protein
MVSVLASFLPLPQTLRVAFIILSLPHMLRLYGAGWPT